MDGFTLKKNERKIIDINDKLVRDKKIPKTRLHFLRHYHATWLYENNVLDQLKNHRAPTKRKQIELKA
ncbi:MAG: hypothetical protein VR66_01725 [Peptococcaceae bacterium BRH_c23]|nr:MAG: hypothetical protein VR66_01725 [Peptococcaceae bacterium BRH_c23]KJS88845.1 MAG: hypothetical protein JL57_10500 [Desulfosporosinus sp. BICA1-9]